MNILPDITEDRHDRLTRIVRSYISAFSDLDVAYAVYADRSRNPMSPDDFADIVRTLPVEEPVPEAPTDAQKIGEVLTKHGVGSGIYGKSHVLYIENLASNILKALA